MPSRGGVGRASGPSRADLTGEITASSVSAARSKARAAIHLAYSGQVPCGRLVVTDQRVAGYEEVKSMADADGQLTSVEVTIRWAWIVED